MNDLVEFLNQWGCYLLGSDGLSSSKTGPLSKSEDNVKIRDNSTATTTVATMTTSSKRKIDRKRHDFLGFLIVFNVLEIGLSVRRAMDVGGSGETMVRAKQQQALIVGWWVTVCLTAKVVVVSYFSYLYFYRYKSIRQRGDRLGMICVLISGFTSLLSLLNMSEGEQRWGSYWSNGALHVMMMQSICLLPSFGRQNYRTCLTTCWGLVLGYLGTGVLIDRNPSIALPYCLLVLFFANIVSICKKLWFLNKRDMAHLFDLNSERTLSSNGNKGNKGYMMDDDINAVLLLMRSLKENLALYSTVECHERLDRIIGRLESRKSLNLGRGNGIRNRESNMSQQTTSSTSSGSSKLKWLSHGATSVPNHAVELFEAEMVGGREVLSRAFYKKQRSFRSNRRETYTGRHSSGLSKSNPKKHGSEKEGLSATSNSSTSSSILNTLTRSASSGTVDSTDMRHHYHELGNIDDHHDHIGNDDDDEEDEDAVVLEDGDVDETISGSCSSNRRRRYNDDGDEDDEEEEECEQKHVRQSSDLGPKTSPILADIAEPRRTLMSDLGIRKRRPIIANNTMDDEGASSVASSLSVGSSVVTSASPHVNQINIINSNNGNNRPVFYTGRYSRDRNTLIPELSNILDRQQHHEHNRHSNEDEEEDKDDSSEIGGHLLCCEDGGVFIPMEITKEQSKYMREMVLDWNFGEGGLFARLDDANMPPCFKSKPLTTLFLEASLLFDCVDSLDIDVDRMVRFMETIENKYLPRDRVQYHNSWHATDVLQSACCLLSIDKIRKSLIDPALSYFAVLFSAAIHDVAHPGRNQGFQIKTQSELAVLYSDRSVLEHHHLAVAFSTLRKHKSLNFLDVLDEADSKLFREKVIQMVLATDMATHLDNLNSLKELIASERPLSRAKDLVETNRDPSIMDEMQTVYESDNNIILCSILHCSDLGNVAKDWSIYKQWIPMIFGEFFDQGDEERRLGFEVVSSYNRDTCYPCEMQIYFIDLFVNELVENLNTWCPELGTMIIPNIEANLKKLQQHNRVKIENMW